VVPGPSLYAAGAAAQGMHAKPVSIKKVTQYSANWVKSQSRMSSTSNQETWRADIAGRVVFDLLRQVCRHDLHMKSCVRAGMPVLLKPLVICPPRSGPVRTLTRAMPALSVWKNSVGTVSGGWCRADPQILTACNLASFSLVDACQSLLGRRLEVLPPSVTAALAGLVPPPPLLAAVP
jgi:hypothetical protein